jgi:hypothetical protein
LARHKIDSHIKDAQRNGTMQIKVAGSIALQCSLVSWCIRIQENPNGAIGKEVHPILLDGI